MRLFSALLFTLLLLVSSSFAIDAVPSDIDIQIGGDGMVVIGDGSITAQGPQKEEETETSAETCLEYGAEFDLQTNLLKVYQVHVVDVDMEMVVPFAILFFNNEIGTFEVIYVEEE